MMTQAQITLTISIILTLCAVSLLPTKAAAHGGASVEATGCEVSAGAYQLQFSSYQSGGFGQKYCERVPEPGQTSLFIDFDNRQLRTVPITVEVIEGSHHGDGVNTVLSVPAKVYAQGSIELDHAFKQPGEYVVIARFADGAERFEARFPFTVGGGTAAARFVADSGPLLMLLVLLVAVAGGLYHFSTHRSAPLSA